MRIVAFRPEHLRDLELQDAQQYFGSELLRSGYGEMLARSGQAFTAIGDNGVIICSGCREIWPQRAEAWALVSRHAGKDIVAIHRAVDGFLKQAPWRRIEASVDVGFAAGMRWLTMLGFVNETPDKPMRAYRPDGGDSYLFARVNP